MSNILNYIIINCDQGNGILEREVSSENLNERLSYWRNNFPQELESSIYSLTKDFVIQTFGEEL